jgi:hypothetical protein
VCQENFSGNEVEKLTPEVFDSSEVSGLVGIGSALLNKFVENGSYGIRPSIKSGQGRGGRRLFSSDDVLGIALVWWLFESGLRSGTIQIVLNSICGTKSGQANDAAKKLTTLKTYVLEIHRTPRQGFELGKIKHPRTTVHLIPRSDRHLTTAADNIELNIPVEHLYASLNEKMKHLADRTGA